MWMESRTYIITAILNLRSRRWPRSTTKTEINDDDRDQWRWQRSITITSMRYYRKASSYLRLSPDLRKHLRTRNHRRYKTTPITMTRAHTNLSTHQWNHMLMDLRYDSHLSQLEAGSDRGSGGRRIPKISKTRKRSSTSSKRLPNDFRKHQRLPCEYQLIHP
jgi:hypothetical protein